MLVYGFRAYPKRAEIYAHPFTGAAIATPVLDILMRQDNGVVTDRTSFGNNGTCAGCVGARGVFDEGQKFNGVGNTINCGSNPSLDVAGDISGCAWVFSKEAAAQYVLVKWNIAALGWGLLVSAGGAVQADFYAGPSTTVGVNSVRKGWSFVGFTVAGTVCRLFADGLQEARAVIVMSDAPASSLHVGSGVAVVGFWNGLIELPQVFSGALSPEQVYRKYLEASQVPIYLDDFSSYPVDFAPKTAGAMCGPLRVLLNTLKVTVDANGKHWINPGSAADGIGNMQWPEPAGYGTWEFDVFKGTVGGAIFFAPLMSAGGLYYAATQNGYLSFVQADGSIGIYRCTAGGLVAFAYGPTPAGVVPVGTQHRLRLVRRIGGQWAVYVKGGTYPDYVLVSTPSVDNTHVAGGFSQVVLASSLDTTDKISGSTYLRTCERPASFPWEFSTGTYGGVVSGSTVWMNCLTAGVTYLPKDLDWQTMILGVWRGAAPNVLDTLFLASEIGSTVAASQNGYCLRMAADGAVQLVRTSGGIEAAPTATTVAGYTAINTEYEFKINRVWSTNAYQFFIRGGAYGATWTLMFAATLGIYTSSNYQNFDLDADDRITAPAYYRDVR